MTDWAAVREHFPALEGRAYLNTAGGGPMCREAFSRVQHYYESFYREGDTQWDMWLEQVEAARERLARLLNVGPHSVAFLANASQGLNLVADMLDGEGRVVALTDDFPSVTLPWLSRDRDVLFIDDPKAIEEAAVGASVLAVGLVQYKTGERLDLKRLSRLRSEHATSVVVDATQAFAVSNIDLERTPVDALVFSAYKWASAGYGIAPLVIHPALIETKGLPSAGWRSAREPYALESRTLDPTTEARGLELGHPPFAGILALDGALELIESIGLGAIEMRVADLVETLRGMLDERGIEILSPRTHGERSAITMIRVADPVATAASLAERNIFVSARGDGLRVSVHYFNDASDLETLVEALAAG